LEGGTFTLIEISVIKVLSLSPIPQTGLVSGERIARPDDVENEPQGQSAFCTKVSVVKIFSFEKGDDQNSSYALIF
jgi:hypothetical protein